MTQKQQPLPSNGDDEMAESYDAGAAYTPAVGPVLHDDEIDLDNIPPRLPAGVYTMQVVTATATRSKADFPQVILDCAVTDGEYQGQRVKNYLTFSTPGAQRAALITIESMLGRGVKIPKSTAALAAALQDVTFRGRVVLREFADGGGSVPSISQILGPATNRATVDFG